MSPSVYFIHTILGGLVKKIPNIGTCRSPPSRFKEICTIYSSKEANNIKMPMIVGERVTRSQRELNSNDYSFGDDSAKRSKANQSDDRRDKDSNELDIIEMTLKEFKDRCKGKKRKVSKSIDSTDPDFKISKNLDPVILHLKEEVSEREETLSFWKQRLSKKRRVRKGDKLSGPPSFAIKVKEESECSLLSNVPKCTMLAAVNSVPIIHGSSEMVEICELNRVTCEISEIESSDDQNLSYCSKSASSAMTNTPDELSPIELLERVHSGGNGDVVSGELSSIDSEVCSGEISAELHERVESELGSSKVGSSRTSTIDYCCVDMISTKCLWQPEDNPSSTEERVSSLTSESSLRTSWEQNMENTLTHPFSSFCINDSPAPMDMEVQGYRLYSNPGNELPGLDSEGFQKSAHEAFMKHEGSLDIDMEIASDPAECSTSDASDLCTLSQDCKEPCKNHENRSSLREALCPVDENIVAKACVMNIDHSSQFLGFCNKNDGWVLVETCMDGEMPDTGITISDARKEVTFAFNSSATESIDDPCIPSLSSNFCYGATNNFHSCEDNLPTNDGIHLSSTTNVTMPVTVNEAENVFTKFASSDPANEIIDMETSTLKPSRPPEKLLSTRKVISPQSQEKLRRAAKVDDLCDDTKPSKNRKNLCLEKWSKSKVSTGACVGEADLMINKPKNMKIISPSVANNSVKPLHVSCALSCDCVQCIWINEHAQKAITFSQRQMHDFESLASRLVNGLKSMKVIIEDALLSEECMHMPSNFNISEIQEAAKEAIVLEDNTRKWLTMMTKDCNRFCKIMTSTKTKAASKENDTHREHRKVVFADEAGGALCHVKIM